MVTRENLCCTIDWVSLILGRQIKKVSVPVTFLLYFVLYLRAISKYKPPRAHIRRGDLTEGIFALRV